MQAIESKIVCCDHCGDECTDEIIVENDQHFCCNGCLMVFQLLSEHGLSDYYRYEKNPGISQSKKAATSYEYLEDEAIVSKLTQFRNDDIAKITLHLPQIHCSSCLWLLENLNKLNENITHVSVNFTTKKANITFVERNCSLKTLVELLARIGYEPRINFDSLDTTKKHTYDKKLLYKLGLAGFAFGNIMLLSFPEYLGFDKASYLFHIGYINIILAIPVLLYSGADYIKSAWQGLKVNNLNIDLPIALGMITLFSRSVYEILSHSGEGYLDSFAGFVFFLLIGRWFQSFTYQALDFERNYKAYFPISATIKTKYGWVTKSVDKVVPGDTLRIRNQELIPVDSMVHKGEARIDYSFVTGESDLIHKHKNDVLYAGGKHLGESIEIIATKKIDQSYLTQLWNEDTFKNQRASDTSRLIANISKYFTYIILSIAFLTFAFWLWKDSSRAFYVFTAVLIVACPCALALAIPFTYGNILRLLSQNGLYLKNVATIERIQDVNHIIFDKTGTVTDNQKIHVAYEGKPLTDEQRVFIKSACFHSSHPLSKAIVSHFKKYENVEIDSYTDYIGEGFTASWNGMLLKLGSSQFIQKETEHHKRGVFVEIDGQYVGYFNVEQPFRKNIQSIIQNLSKAYKLGVLSGDNDGEKQRITTLFSQTDNIYFNQSPKDKLDNIRSIQSDGNCVMMIGDGLNDAGALKQSDVGLVISDQVNNFSPACDGMLDADNFTLLHKLIDYIRSAKKIIYGAFFLAFMYNSIGLYFAITGQLSPVIAAILMPLSSITVIVYGITVSYISYKRQIKTDQD